MREFTGCRRAIRIHAWIVFLAMAGIQTHQPRAAQGPCDIYAAAATPCVAAYSTVRSLSATYTGSLYQVRKAGGGTKDIGVIASGTYANSNDQETFCGSEKCTISILYDQSGKGNDLTKAPAGCYTGTASLPDNESNAKGRSLMVGGHKVYALYMIPQDGYRNNKATGMPTGSAAQGIYEIADGKRIGGACCWDFGNASTNNCNGGTGNMNTLYFGTGYWGKGAGKGPWFLADLENGVWAGGTGASNAVISTNPSMTMDFAVGILKTNSANYAIRTANAQSGGLTTAYDGNTPATLHWAMHGGIVLGIGGDNSNSSEGTFFEGVITSGRPTDATDALILKNIQDAGYGSSNVGTRSASPAEAPDAAPFHVFSHPSNSGTVFSISAQGPRRVTLRVFDQRGKQVATLIDGVIPSGDHEVAWDAGRAPAGVYLARMAADGRSAWAEKILIR
jgi:non-reducing end alpha-L-arabinofuranosidase